MRKPRILDCRIRVLVIQFCLHQRVLWLIGPPREPSSEAKSFLKFGSSTTLTINNMSRLGKKPLTIPEKTEVSVKDFIVTVKGPLGETKRTFKPKISIKVENGLVVLSPNDPTNETNALWGTYASHIKNMINGVNKLFEKKLVIEGIGFKSEVKGQEIVFNLGFSHQIKLPVPQGLKVTSEKGVMTITGIDLEAVGQFAAKIRDLKRPEPYKGKGIRYDDEVIRRKQGKKAV